VFCVDLIVENEYRSQSLTDFPINVNDIVSSKRIESKRERTAELPLNRFIGRLWRVFWKLYAIPKLKSLDSLFLDFIIFLFEIITGL
jgi:hypothetical protein